MNDKFINRLVGVITLYNNWVWLLLSKLFEKVFRVAFFRIEKIRMRNGVIFEVLNKKLDTDLFIIQEIWLDKVYNPPFFSIGAKDIVVDIGANKGYFGIYAAKQATNGKVFCLEPVLGLCNVIKKNAEQNHLRNIEVYNFALSNTESEKDFYIYHNNNSTHSMYEINIPHEKVKVKTVELGNFCAKHSIQRINFLKMDCEGSEYEIIFGLKKEVLKSIDKISMEYHDYFNNHNHQELVDYLSNNGFMVEIRDIYLYAINKQILHRA